MSGPTGAQEQLQDEQISAYQQAQQMTAEQYANQQAIYAPMAAQFQKIFAGGPNQEGFSDAEKTDLDSQAITGTAQNYKQAATAVGENMASEGGGTEAAPSGSQEQLKEQVGESAAQSESQQETQIDEADWSQGLSEWQNAGEGLQAIAAGDNPLGFENAETSSGSAAGTTASQIAQEQDSWENAAIGAAGSIAGGFAGDFNFGSSNG